MQPKTIGFGELKRFSCDLCPPLNGEGFLTASQSFESFVTNTMEISQVLEITASQTGVSDSGEKTLAAHTEPKETLRRNLSFCHDTSRKRKPLCRSSLSDLSDQISGFRVHEVEEFDLQFPYTEIVAIAGVSDIPMLSPSSYDGSEDEPPGPGLSRRPSSSRAESPPKPKAVISLVSPHKLLILDTVFCDLFGYSGRSEAEICGRTIKILQGPRTDLAAITCGIKNCAAGSTTRARLVLYDRDGGEIAAEATFSPYLSGLDSLAGCLLELTPSPRAADLALALARPPSAPGR